MRCLSCGHENRAEARFCDACGAPVAASATAGASHAASEGPRSYTPAHLAQKILTSRSALEGERKQVTVLFCDIANSTEAAQRLGAEAMHEMLNAFFELALAEVHGVEGTVNQFLGDGFMALFGAPLAHEDHVRRALAAALAIRQRLHDAPKLAGLQVCMGLNTGTVVVGKIGDNLRLDYTAVGDTTNIAARLQGLAQPGQVCASEVVKAIGQTWFEFTPLGNHLLKGIREPRPVHELVRARPRATPRDGNANPGDRAQGLGIASPLVGRDAELAAAATAVASLRRGEGGVVVITGEAGSGKSRLMAELQRRHGGADLLWLEGHALSFGRHLSYWPFVEIVKTIFAIDDDDGEGVSWHKLESGLGALFGERMPELLVYVATVLALRAPPEHEDRVRYLDGPGLKRQVFLCMRQLFEALAQRRPVVLLLEDWHWADQSSAELAEHLLPLALSGPLLVLVPTRPDPDGAVERVRRFVAEQAGPRCREVLLGMLNEAQVAQLVSNLVGTGKLPAMLHEQIVRKTGGNPFFVEEVIRSLVSDGVLARDGHGAWHLVKPLSEVRLPDTVQGLIMARIDRLDDEVKQALKLASVIGRSFFDRVLESIAEAQGSLATSLSELEDAELIRLKQRQPELEYIFKHVLVQEAAYGSILQDQRRAIHRRVAQAIERLFAGRLDEFTSLLAHHYTCAEDWEKAQEYLFKAGDQAGRMAADAEALEHLRRAEAAYMKAYGDRLSPLQRATLARKVGAALFGTGQYEPAHAEMRQALAQLGMRYPATRAGVRLALLRYLGAHAWSRWRERIRLPPRRAMEVATAAEAATIADVMSWIDYFLDKERMLLDGLLQLRVGELSGHAQAEARGLSTLGFGFMTFGLRGLARRYHHRAIAVAQRSDDPGAIAFAWFCLAFLDMYDGQWDECEARAGKALALYRECGDLHRSGAAAITLSWVLIARGDLAGASQITQEMVRAGKGAADPQLASWGLQNHGSVFMALGPLEEAEGVLREGHATALRIQAWDNLLHQQSLLAKCLVLQGRVEEALPLVEEGQRIAAREGLFRDFEVVELRVATAAVKVALAERESTAAAAEKDSTAAAAAVQASTAAVRCARHMPLWLPQALRHHGNALHLAGEPSAARKAWRECQDITERDAFRVERGLVLFDQGRLLGDAQRVELAAAVFRQNGALAYLGLATRWLAQVQAEPAEPPQPVLERA